MAINFIIEKKEILPSSCKFIRLKTKPQSYFKFYSKFRWKSFASYCKPSKREWFALWENMFSLFFFEFGTFLGQWIGRSNKKNDPRWHLLVSARFEIFCRRLYAHHSKGDLLHRKGVFSSFFNFYEIGMECSEGLHYFSSSSSYSLINFLPWAWWTEISKIRIFSKGIRRCAKAGKGHFFTSR